MQESPKNLLETFQKPTLEEVFFILSRKQDHLATNQDGDQSKNEGMSGSLDTIATSTSMESFVMGYGSRDVSTCILSGISINNYGILGINNVFDRTKI